ncbi:hypothetical protein [Photobacterium toruni]|uniref:hypothetical protein n=1 Tax=Photobacterium toruni TaxID=1935446 RepID=UPI002110949E|nr:hypothetical protein [Photobacterium toruni]
MQSFSHQLKVKIPRNAAYKLLRKVDMKNLGCSNNEERRAAAKLAALPASRIVDQIQQYADSVDQRIEMTRRCRVVGLDFYSDLDNHVQFKL